MSCKPKTEKSLFLLVAFIYFSIIQLCCAVSLFPREDGSRGYRVQQQATKWESEQDKHRQRRQLEVAIESTWRVPLQESSPFGPRERGESLLGYSSPDDVRSNAKVSLNDSSWTIGNVRKGRRPSTPNSEDEYQADFTGFSEIQGEVQGLSSDTSPHFFEWESMKPEVECEDNFMIFSASGQGLLYLLVDQREGPPISIFQIPPHCGYSVRTSWSDLEMTVPYDGCYVNQENGSHILPMQWLSSPLKLTCPVNIPNVTPASPLSSPLVFCSAYGMAVQIHGQEPDLPLLGVMVDGSWGPFVSDFCAFQVDAQQQQLTYLISHSSPCITVNNGPRLQLTLDNEEYILSCPANLHFPNGSSQVSLRPEPISPISSFYPPPQIQNSGQVAYFPDYSRSHEYHSGFQYNRVQNYYPRQSYPAQQSSVYSSPAFQQELPYTSNPGTLPNSFGSHLSPPPYHFFVQGQVPKPSSGPHPYQFVYYPNMPFHGLGSNPAENQENSYPSSYPQIYLHPGIHPPSSLEQTYEFKHQTTNPYTPPAHNSHHPVAYSASYLTGSPSNPTDNTGDWIKHPFSQFYSYQTPFYVHNHPFLLHSSQEPAPPQTMCLTSTGTSCNPYSYPFPPYVHTNPFYQQYGQSLYFPNVQTPTTIPSTTQGLDTLQVPHLQCLHGRLFVFLPHADPQSIHILEHHKTWKPLTNVPSQCGFLLEKIGEHGVVLSSPLPACHSYLRTPTTISLPIRFWDGSVQQNRPLDLQCPYQSPPETPASPTPHQSEEKSNQGGSVNTEVTCTSYHMTALLPPGPTSEIFVTDAKGSPVNRVQDQNDCGYYVSTGKDGKIHLIYLFHSHCHQSVEGEMHVISVVYETENGRKETQFSCPAVKPRSGQECNLQSEYRLPCGSSSISQTQCLAMGCCFNKHPPDCYYPMDECTIDRRMVFSVPASLTNPPISPALLVAAHNSTCKPEKVTLDYALFNIPMDSCGIQRMMVGKTLVYMLEITNMIQAVRLNYGTITRDSPIRVIVECRYEPGKALSVSYIVKTPTFGPEVHAQGVFGVQLRIAKDAEYSSYHPQYHQPLRMLLGKPLHLEVRLLNSPDPSLVLLVHFCVAYPRSGKAVWVLLYNGCPNPLDPSPPKTVLSGSDLPTPQSQIRRFTISTFQFLPDGDHKDMDEEVYFMCSTEICSPHDEPCVEGCFGH